MSGDPFRNSINRESLKYMVQREIFCPFTGNVLDVRNAVEIDITKPDGKTVPIVMIAEHWDACKDEVLATEGYTIEVLDGRELFGGK